MTIYSTANRAGVQPINSTSSTQNHPLGTIVGIQDSTAGSGGQGAGEAIYLQGAANTIEGSIVTYNTRDGSTTLVPTSNKNLGWPIAVAMSINNTTGSYGWYQIAGVAKVAKDAVDFGTAAKVYASTTTAGYVQSSVASSAQLLGAITANSASVSSTTSTIFVEINRPHLTGTVLA